MQDRLFWYARIAQAFFIFVSCLIFIAPFWAIIYLNIIKVAVGFDISFLQITQISLFPYPKSLLTAFLIGLVLAFRSATWGSVSLLFAILCSFIVSLLIMVISAVLQFFWPQLINDSGFGAEFNFAWLVAWMSAGALYYWLLVASGFHERYNVNERKNLIAIFWVVITYGIFTPVLYVLITAKLALGEGFAMVVSGPIKQAQVEITAYLMATILVFIAVGFMRRLRKLTFFAIIMLPIMVCLVFLSIRLIIIPDMLMANLLWFYVGVYFYLALFLIIIASVVFYLCGIIGVKKTTKLNQTIWFYHQPHNKKNTLMRAIIMFSVMLLVAPIIWHFANQSLLAIFTGYPLRGYIWRNIWIAYVHAGVIFGGIIAIWVSITARLQFRSIFMAGLAACFIGFFLPGRPFVLSFGFYIDYIAWPMLSYLIVSICCWLLWVGLDRLEWLARLKQK